MNTKFHIGEHLEYNTRFRPGSNNGAWVPAQVIEVNHSLDEQGIYTVLTLRLYNDLVIRVHEVEQKLCLRPLGSKWDIAKQEWVL